MKNQDSFQFKRNNILVVVVFVVIYAIFHILICFNYLTSESQTLILILPIYDSFICYI